MILIDPTTQNEFTLFGVKIAISRTVVVVPLSILLLNTVRGIVINNIQYIAKDITSNKDKLLLKKFILSYPLIDFLRWKSSGNLQTVLLTIIQAIFDFFPSAIIVAYPILLEISGYRVSDILKIIIEIIAMLNAYLGVRYTLILRRGVYELIAGQISTPD